MAQTHLAMLKFHNKVCDMLSSGANPPAEIFAEARRIVTWHYQWIVLHDWVERLTEKGIVAKILHDGPQVLSLQEDPLHAGRVLRGGLPPRPLDGARSAIPHNRVFNTPQDFSLFFTFSGLSGDIIGDLAAGGGGFPTLPSNWIIDWRRFYDLGPSGGAAVTATPSRRIDPYLVASLHNLPGGGGNLAVPQPQARRQPRPAVGSGRGQAHEGQEPADAGGDRVRQQRLDRRRRRQGSRACIPRRRSGTTSSRKPRSGTTACGSDRSARPSSRKCSSGWCTATTIPSCGGSRTGSRRCRRRRRATFTMVDLLRFVDDINPLGD